MAKLHYPLCILFLLLSFSPSLQQQTFLHPSDVLSLHDLRTSLQGLPGSKFFSSWDFSNGDPCTTFTGVVCSRDDENPSSQVLRVSVLTLGTGLTDSPGLTGTLPESICNLTYLSVLVLYPGQVTGSIPSSLGSSLRRLRLLSLTNNLLTGPVPDSLAGLADLHTLDLSNNQLSGPIPPSLFLPSSPNLKVLILSNNGGLTGEIPAGFSTSQILHLDLTHNSIYGELPMLPATLRYLSVAQNNMCGTLETAFAGTTIPDLEFLDLSMNAISGQIPSHVFYLPSLTSIFLDRNNFTGTITVPASKTPISWTVIDLSHNGISGQIPAGLASAGALYLNSNRFIGSVPDRVVQSIYSGQMATFYAQHNFLTEFPTQPDPLPDSVALCLSYNCMVLPLAGANCPMNGGPLQSRPQEQCISIASTGGD
ncbi:Leucine-rich repeat receptor-like protein kinase [Rhynchospora pubera]|uniref:Leucine-rich repeat receptor-like protein kinase n=1 Tax=Rhynchospora pubera TaxID=906938 RepID=A0AAV8EKK2_9POAL|nr:Leucine-rich repeat receptor-like protein kinase [Rhynchospora pubera]